MWKIFLFLAVLSINQMLGDCKSRACETIRWSKAVNVTSTEFAVRWDCCSSRDDPTYRLQIESMGTRDCSCDFQKLHETNGCSHTFSNLCSHANYQFTVSKYRLIGRRRGFDYDDYTYDDDIMASSLEITVRTRDSAPGRVTMKEAIAINDTAINLNWEHDCPNGNVFYNVTWSLDESASVITRELELTVVNLKPVTLYTFVIKACNDINSTMCSDSSTVLVRTFPGEPSEPTKFEAYHVSSSEIHLRWNHPEDPKGPIDGYEIVCCQEGNLYSKSISILINETEEYLVTGLQSWTNYSCSIQAFNLQDFEKINGSQSTLTVTTKSARPDEPTFLEIVDITSDMLFLKWKHPLSPRGPIDGYVVRTWNGEIEIENVTSEEFHLSGLSPWKQYNITVHAFNVDGNYTLNGKVAAVSGKTRPAAPSAPRDVKVVKTISGETYLKWKPPLTTNGVIDGYSVKNLNDESEVVLPGSILKHHLDALIPDTNYTFSVYAFNLDGLERLDGKVASVDHQTKPEGVYITDPAVAEMINLLRKDIISELSKMQAMMRKMFRNFGEESYANNQKHDIKSLPEKAPEHRTLDAA